MQKSTYAKFVVNVNSNPIDKIRNKQKVTQFQFNFGTLGFLVALEFVYYLMAGHARDELLVLRGIPEEEGEVI